MKPTIHKGLSHDKLLRVVPERFRHYVPKSLPEPITAILFGEEVVTGRIAQKTIKRFVSDLGACVVCVGRDFTKEAADRLASAGALLFTPSAGTTWTDESLVEIRTMLATHRPLHTQSETNEPTST